MRQGEEAGRLDGGEVGGGGGLWAENCVSAVGWGARPWLLGTRGRVFGLGE